MTAHGSPTIPSPKAPQYAAPKATERISYAIPFYEYHGRLAYFAAFRDHVSLFAAPSRAIQKAFAQELELYQTGKSTLRFPIGSKVPVGLVKRLVRARMKENEAKAKQRIPVKSR